MFEPLPARFDFPAAEKRVLAFWDEHDIFGLSLTQRKQAGAPRFVFYEGPPTANGLPHPGHCLTRAIKDVFPRYRTMTGHLVERKAGWDTHGLPVEVEVCKELTKELGRSIHTKQEIEQYGVEKFNLRCIQSVFRYTREWEEMTRRLGFWVNLKDAYVTFHQSYVESVWWGLKTLFERGLLYQGHKVVWWWAQGGTALSAGEVGEGYKTVDDPSVFVKFPLFPHPPLKDQQNPPPHAKRTSLLVWTTTPWTLISNHFAAVHPDLEYALVEDDGDGADEPEYLYLAADLVEAVAKRMKRELRVILTCRGRDLLDRKYIPPFDVYFDGHVAYDETPGTHRRSPEQFAQADQGIRWSPLGITKRKLSSGGTAAIGWRVLAADFVTIDSGTGLVHEAPAFGEVDFNLLQEERKRFENPNAIPLLNAVNPDGTFNDDAPPQYRGRWVKDCDKDIIRELRDERKTPWGTPLLYHQEVVRHEYPFCPRAEDDALIQYARKSWFVRTSQFKDEFLKNNAAINWLPEHIKEGRFGDFLRNNVDWALSRERYWGTPLPIWVCEKCGKMEAVGSFAELRGKPEATDGGYWEAKVAEHRAQGEELPQHLQVHKPYIDEWTYACGECGRSGESGRSESCGTGLRPVMHGPEARETDTGQRPVPQSTQQSSGSMRRVPEVIDCWWDAGSMPFAQWGYPHTTDSIRTFMERFPADFISEAIDQTRGWFYGLLAISTLLFGGRDCEDADSVTKWLAGPDGTTPDTEFPHSFKTCIVLGLILGEDGLKMSKRKKNYREPSYIFDQYGADAMRWYFFSGQAPWTSIRFQEAAIRDAQREFLVKLYNVLSFFTIYASIDGFEAIPDAAHGKRPTAERSELDRWIISELHRTIRFVRESMDRFENFPAAQRLSEFVEALSNWYVRRSRERFWRGIEGSRDQGLKAGYSANDQDKWDAYHTLYGCLYTLSLLIAPFTPFFAETMYQTLTRGGGTCRADQPARPETSAHPVSVHLCDYPAADGALIDEALAAEMDIVREISSLGRAARAASSEPRLKKVRQPAALVEIILTRPEHAEWLAGHAAIIGEELNVKRVEFAKDADKYVTYKVVPNFKAIGAKFRALVPKLKEALAALTDPAAARKTLIDTGALPLTIDGQSVQLTPEEVEIRLDAKPGWSAAQGKHGVVVLSSEITPELIEEGLIREFIHHVQALRKEHDLAYEARITLNVDCDDAFWAILTRHVELVRNECLCDAVDQRKLGEDRPLIEVEQHKLRLMLA